MSWPDIEDEWIFYSKLSKPLILNLPNWKDRVLAASWVRKLKDESAGTESLRVVYLKLLLFALQRQRLVGIFADDPSKYDELEAIPEGFDLNDIAKNLLEVEFAERQDRIRQQLRGQVANFPPYITDCSSDFREYVAVQDIPGFGVHCYYAASKEPVNKWNRAERGVFPKMARSAVNTTSPLISDTPVFPSAGPSGDPLCLCVKNQEDADPDCECKKRVKLPPTPKRKHTRKFGKTPPIPIIGTKPPIDDRTPPIWGSNLTQVKDIPQKGESDDELEHDEEFGLTDVLPGFEQFVDEYKKGEMDKVSKMSQKRIVVPTGQSSKGEGGLEDDDDEYEDEEQMDLNTSRRIEEIKADNHLINYYRDLLSKTIAKHNLDKVTEDIDTSTPSRTGIPLTTPKSSPSPKRLEDSERLYEQEPAAEQHLPMVVTPPPTTNICKAKRIEEVSPTDDEFTKWNKRLKAVQRKCEVNLSRLDASQQVDKSVSISRKGVPKKDRACGPGTCGYPCI